MEKGGAKREKKNRKKYVKTTSRQRAQTWQERRPCQLNSPKLAGKSTRARADPRRAPPSHLAAGAGAVDGEHEHVDALEDEGQDEDDYERHAHQRVDDRLEEALDQRRDAAEGYVTEDVVANAALLAKSVQANDDVGDHLCARTAVERERKRARGGGLG